MADVVGREKRDLVLAEGEYAYMQDVTKGIIKVYNGPTVINPSAQEIPIRYNAQAATFERCESLEEAKRQHFLAPEGYYCVLLNPAKNAAQPVSGQTKAADELAVGRKVVIPGPAQFALWPGQKADLVRGHHLRSNQYLLVRVYNEDEAKKNWGSAVIKPAAPTVNTEGMTDKQAEEAHKKAADAAKNQPPKKLSPPADLTVGKLLVIRGTEVSFYIPPTGITVVKDDEVSNTSKATYVREALTLERLEYAILIDEDGNKRYEKGPTVVFPKPTEKFKEGKGEDGSSSRKFRAIELNPIQGIHLKVIADFEENKRQYKAGEELFVTGKDSTIFYPREELATIKYDGKTKSYAVAVPAGEARYVMDRMKGDIETVKGPAMLLPDPRTQVIAQRILTDKQCGLWYPGNAEALDFNQKLRPVVSQIPTTRGGVPSAGDMSRALGRGMKGLAATESMLSANYAMIADSSQVSKDQSAEGDEFSRSASFTSPRSITLNTKFHGVPMIDVWTGFAVMVVSKSGKRRVEVGPKTVLLDYDETLEVLELSTGKPKTTDNLQKTVYLRVENNQVTDIIRAETVDHVQVEMKLSYRVNFKGDATKWFSVDNYIKYLCDHERSIVKGNLKKTPVEDFYKNSTDLIREMILGKAPTAKGESKEAHSTFPNGMEITDVEVLGVTIADDRIRALLDASQTDVVKSNIEVAMLQRNLKVTGEKAQVTREIATIENQTMLRKNALESEAIKSTTLVHLQALASKLEELEKTQVLSEEEQGLKNLLWDSDLNREKKAHEQRNAINAASQALQVALMQAEAETLAKKFGAVGENFSEALLSLSNNDTLEKVAKALSIQTVLGGNSLSDALQKAFTGTTVATTVKKLLTNGESTGKSAPTA